MGGISLVPMDGTAGVVFVPGSWSDPDHCGSSLGTFGIELCGAVRGTGSRIRSVGLQPELPPRGERGARWHISPWI